MGYIAESANCNGNIWQHSEAMMGCVESNVKHWLDGLTLGENVGLPSSGY